MASYQELRRQYEELSDELKRVEGKRADLRHSGLIADLASNLPAGLTSSSVTSAAFPLLIAYIYWVTGAALITAGLLYLALVQRIGRPSEARP